MIGKGAFIAENCFDWFEYVTVNSARFRFESTVPWQLKVCGEMHGTWLLTYCSWCAASAQLKRQARNVRQRAREKVRKQIEEQQLAMYTSLTQAQRVYDEGVVCITGLLHFNGMHSFFLFFGVNLSLTLNRPRRNGLAQLLQRDWCNSYLQY